MLAGVQGLDDELVEGVHLRYDRLSLEDAKLLLGVGVGAGHLLWLLEGDVCLERVPRAAQEVLAEVVVVELLGVLDKLLVQGKDL